jgi:hypothetical protein
MGFYTQQHALLQEDKDATRSSGIKAFVVQQPDRRWQRHWDYSNEWIKRVFRSTPTVISG